MHQMNFLGIINTCQIVTNSKYTKMYILHKLQNN